MSSSWDLDLPGAFEGGGGTDPRGTAPDGRPPGVTSGSVRGSGRPEGVFVPPRFDCGAGGDGSGRDAGSGFGSPGGGGLRCVAGALLLDTGAPPVSSARALPQLQVVVPRTLNDSQRPQTIPITGSIERAE